MFLTKHISVPEHFKTNIEQKSNQQALILIIFTSHQKQIVLYKQKMLETKFRSKKNVRK